ILDSVIVGEESSDKTSILEAWNGLSDSLSRQREYVLSVISEAEEFISDERFGTLDSVVKADYWTRVNATKQALENTLNQTSFYQLLSRVEHTEQTVDFLWNTFESVKAYFFILHRHQQLQARGIKRHTNRCIKVRDRLCNEITNLMNLLEEVIEHPTFETMDTERKELYHAKWRTYLKKCDQLSGN
ncbi:hypothetical protein KA071_03110, partial [Candidatus Gracilibacteria bacterium]|nr:hypothetical protein [Candidatus Gracilibacteria bacterium]